jgi:hypothetical protein
VTEWRVKKEETGGEDRRRATRNAKKEGATGEKVKKKW